MALGDRIRIGPTPRVACATNPQGDLHICAIGQSDGLWHTIRMADGSWPFAFGDVQTAISGPPSTIKWSWAIILCQFNDIPAVPQPPDYYVDLFTRNGTGGVCDYWRAVSCNALDLTGSQVFGWFTMNHSSAEVSQPPAEKEAAFAAHHHSILATVT